MTLTEQFAVQVILEYARAISRELEALRAQGVKIMGQGEEILGKLTEMDAKADAERAEVQALFQALRDEIANQAQGLPAEQFSAIMVALDALGLKIGAISEPVAA